MTHLKQLRATVLTTLVALTLMVPNAASAIFEVYFTDDAGVGTLRQAIIAANANPGFDTIVFAPTFPVDGVITPATSLPPLSDPTGGTFINGHTAPSGMVTIDGDLTTSSVGLTLSTDGNEIAGLSLVRFLDGVWIAGDSNSIHSNHIGVAPDGQTEMPNTTGIELAYVNGADGNRIGCDGGNVISGNSQWGIYGVVESGYLIIENNMIGVDATGSTAVPNDYAGVILMDPDSVIIGNNVVSGLSLIHI